MGIKDNIEYLKKSIPDDVMLLAVSKTKPLEYLEEAYQCGMRDFGENKVQELVEKYENFHKDVRWHLIGHLQTNKVKYLVDIKKVDPSKILVMSYTKKATEELDSRINDDFNIPVVTTFHNLAYTYIRKIFYNRKCYVVDNNLKNQIFLDYFKEKIFSL